MRISDWSSDVCSSDLFFPSPHRRRSHATPVRTVLARARAQFDAAAGKGTLAHGEKYAADRGEAFGVDGAKDAADAQAAHRGVADNHLLARITVHFRPRPHPRPPGDLHSPPPPPTPS